MGDILSWLNNHGGVFAVVAACLLAVNALLSGVGLALEKMGDLLSKPELGKVGAALLNIVSKIQTVVDWFQGNRAH
jgi:hypothetical protein